MKIVSILEDQNIEKRIAVTPETAKKYISLGIDVTLQENYGKHLGFEDKEYKNLGAVVEKDEKDISILARSGFSYEVSKKVLDIPKEEFLKFCKMI